MPVRLAETCDIRGVGVDPSPHAIANAEEKKRQRVPDSNLRFLQMNGSDYLFRKPV